MLPMQACPPVLGLSGIGIVNGLDVSALNFILERNDLRTHPKAAASNDVEK